MKIGAGVRAAGAIDGWHWKVLVVGKDLQGVRPEGNLEGDVAKRCEDALTELPRETRDMFLLVTIDHWNVGDVAHRHDISVQAVQAHVAQAMAHMARRLSPFSKCARARDCS